ncbi:MAG: hypothetical protein PHH98_01255 [Candidatus Gracilibacteria bacterium]|nr:hypothetical protein [Candidatus Gracilibacteria bacterium]
MKDINGVDVIDFIDASIVRKGLTSPKITIETSFFSKKCSDCLSAEHRDGPDRGIVVDCTNPSSLRGSSVSAHSHACNHIDPR